MKVDLRIVSSYADGSEIGVDRVDVELPEPVTDESAEEHLFCLTGTGKLGVDAYYEITVTRSSDDRLTGRRWSWAG